MDCPSRPLFARARAEWDPFCRARRSNVYQQLSGKAEYLQRLATDVGRGAVPIERLYKLRTHPTPQRVAAIGAKWAPYRTVASWYLWRVVDDPPQ